MFVQVQDLLSDQDQALPYVQIHLEQDLHQRQILVRERFLLQDHPLQWIAQVQAEADHMADLHQALMAMVRLEVAAATVVAHPEAVAAATAEVQLEAAVAVIVAVQAEVVEAAIAVDLLEVAEAATVAVLDQAVLHLAEEVLVEVEDNPLKLEIS